MSEWWKFWKWHFHRCRTESDESGCWGECIVCHKRFGFVDRQTLRAYCDQEIEQEMAPLKSLMERTYGIPNGAEIRDGMLAGYKLGRFQRPR